MHIRLFTFNVGTKHTFDFFLLLFALYHSLFVTSISICLTVLRRTSNPKSQCHWSSHCFFWYFSFLVFCNSTDRISLNIFLLDIYLFNTQYTDTVVRMYTKTPVKILLLFFLFFVLKKISVWLMHTVLKLMSFFMNIYWLFCISALVVSIHFVYIYLYICVLSHANSAFKISTVWELIIKTTTKTT